MFRAPSPERQLSPDLQNSTTDTGLEKRTTVLGSPLAQLADPAYSRVHPDHQLSYSCIFPAFLWISPHSVLARLVGLLAMLGCCVY